MKKLVLALSVLTLLSVSTFASTYNKIKNLVYIEQMDNNVTVQENLEKISKDYVDGDILQQKFFEYEENGVKKYQLQIVEDITYKRIMITTEDGKDYCQVSLINRNID
ncbi:hypothetical protein KMW28_21175 [Flammeovirga yaeyamensis]|uniref:Uncharacterized protein n=1 Tax=Flammeovirga yaeyamensis TaxID=367791 RepID=A0AAX1NEZ4_9BACT|nr:hypothetical protein [Flammeovirga yaeyamensis]MBB3697136.1 ABC-type dipeptide/oligopeptide/nickel transport system permease component [Flammeovirga yaeyamensis]NMF33798.1 hypothetical protein [Flammeovirga yaeyamensis]QWG04938.1 hypothetical protein KMW28_21175 [Flammeovirga yaeyamensis]